MYCFQCEQTYRGTGCSDQSICGKDEASAALQDHLIHATKGICQYAHRARQLGAKDRAIDIFVVEALFTTVTNVNFDATRIAAFCLKAAGIRDQARTLYEKACAQASKTPESLTGPALWKPAREQAGLVLQGYEVSVLKRREKYGADISGLQELLIYGVKGAAAYADHAIALGNADDNIFGFFIEALSYLANEQQTVDALLGLSLRCGEVNYKVMELLSNTQAGAYGHPVPTPVRIEPVKGKCILVSGHDLKDLEELLKQTEGKGVNVYTHGEMLPAHGYPKLKAYKHLVGN